MIQRNILLTFALALVLLAPLAGCSSDSHEPSQPAVARRTILVYMVATNSMGSLDHVFTCTLERLRHIQKLLFDRSVIIQKAR